LPGFTALLDACVLYPAPVRDLLIETANTHVYRARWSNHIHEEWIAAVLKTNPKANADALARTRALMDEAVPDALVTGYEGLIEGLVLPDPKDRHVLAAAIVGRADVIVTANLKHFPADALSPYGIEAQHPDEFLMHQRDLNHERFLQCAKRIRARLVNPPRTAEQYIESLRKCQLVLVADAIEHVRGLI
jgi:predicted nucleic acid-binding protein